MTRDLSALRGIAGVIRLVVRLGPVRSGVAGTAVLVAAVVPVMIAVFTGMLIGSIPAAADGGFGSASGRRTLALLGVVAGLILVQRIVQPLLRLLMTGLGRDLDRHLQEVVMAAVARPVGIDHLDDPSVQADIRIARGLGLESSRPSRAVEALPEVLAPSLQALGAAAVLSAFRWWLGLAWLLAWPVLFFFMQREYVRVGQLGYGQSRALRRAEYLRDLAFAPGTAKELRLWGMLDWLIGRFEATWQASMIPVWRVRRPRLVLVLAITATIVGLNVGSYGLLAFAGARGDIALGALTVYLQALSTANGYPAFSDANAHLAFATVSVPKVLELDGRLIADTASGRSTRAPGAEVRLSGVGFRYPGARRNALGPLDLTIAAGQSLAIVGDNGSGKTTLVKLLCRLYEPSAGSITVDGEPLAGLDPAAWRSKVAVLFQDFTRYHLSVRDNITLGAPDEADELMLRAAVKAGAVDLVESLPRGWDTVLSREYEGGVDLSGGQWQRIALARALYAVETGAELLILDEPTAALDVRAEADLYQRFLELTAGLTTVVISHRFSTVRRAERIVVLSDGGIVEDGSHDELLAADGRYAYMFRLQAERFADA
ncbi:ABC transporter ATP-binding protein [Kribbella sp. NPDC000426]|uniref:ABC transporter ATP-binding protein n=1 Tax=Kribbella sp. NPDC000426 TaxID=3154255 RepID=UPI00332D65A9